MIVRRGKYWIVTNRAGVPMSRCKSLRAARKKESEQIYRLGRKYVGRSKYIPRQDVGPGYVVRKGGQSLRGRDPRQKYNFVRAGEPYRFRRDEE